MNNSKSTSAAATACALARVKFSISLFAAVALISGCNDDNHTGTNNPAPPPAVAPAITAQPADQSVTAGQPASFTITATGTAPLSYQWQRDSTPISGATGSSYALASTATSDSGAHFTVVIGNSAGSVTSKAATLTVAPVNLAPPGTTTVGIAGGTVASDDGKLTVNVAAGALKGDTYFKVAALSTLGGLPNGYVLVTGTAYQITWTGAGFTGEADAALRFANAASGFAPSALRLTAQAVHVLSNSSSGSAVVQCGSDNQVYATQVDPNASSYSDATVILCGPSNGGGSGGSSGQTSTSNVGMMQPDPATVLTITAQPSDVSDVFGDTATFSVAATGGQLLYQWFINSVAIPGATQATYSRVADVADSGAKFSVVISNGFTSMMSREATLTVSVPPPPAPAQWDTPVALTPFGAGIDLPVVDENIDGVVKLAWNSNGVLDTDNTTIHGWALPIRSRPQLLGGPNSLQSYIVFVDDTGTSSCATGTGNRLSAIGLRGFPEYGPAVPSDRFTLYQSPNDCIEDFSAAKVPDAINGITALTFAVHEAGGAMKVGIGGAKAPGPRVNGAQQPPLTWAPTTPVVAALSASSECSNGYFSADGMRGIFQASVPDAQSATLATVAFVSGSGNSAVVCVATLSGSTWSSASKLFDHANEAEPSVAIDGNGNSLVLASLVIDPAASVPAYAMTAAYRPAGGTTWSNQALDSSDAASLPSAAFDYTGNALVVWRPNSSSGKSVVYRSRRAATGSWEPVQPLSAPDAVETRYPRVCVGSSGAALALFEQNFQAGDPFSVFSRYWERGSWSDISQVQLDSNDGRFAECPRNGEPRSGFTVVWRETDPTDATHFRIMSSGLFPRL